MRTVWKYTIPLTNTFTLELPVGWQPVAVQTQHDHPQLWVLVNPHAEMKLYHFAIAGTDYLIREAIIGRLGTFQLRGGELVFHVFLIAEPEKEDES